MKRRTTALRAILREAGVSPQEAGSIERAIDGRAQGGLTGDDIAGALLRWSAKKHEMTRCHELAVAAAERVRLAEEHTLPLPWDA